MSKGIGKAKIIFLGEHFAVYGCKAIGFGLDKKIEVEAKRSVSLKLSFKADVKAQKAVKRVKELLKIENFELSVKQSEIPIASGLGSSAAFSVALIRALANEFKLGLSNEQICGSAFEAEKIFHGSPSGIDNTLAVYGGAIAFQKLESGRRIEKLRVKSPLHIVMIDSCIRSDTRKMIKKIKVFKKKNEKLFSHFLQIESMIVKEAVFSLRAGEIETLGCLMDMNQSLLRLIGASHNENEKIISLAKKQGALGVKIAGAGGGGFCLALMNNKKSALALVEELKNKYQCFYTRIKN